MNPSKFHKEISKNRKLPAFIRLPILVASSWFFQGILYMDATERLFKIIFDLSLIMLILVTMDISSYHNVLIAIILGHSLDWIINGQIFVLLKNLQLTETKIETFSSYLSQLAEEVKSQKCIAAVAAFGSLSRGQIKNSSDLDIRVIRKKGFINAINTYKFIVILRFFAFYNQFPLDVYMLDDIRTISSHINKESPVIIYDPNKILNNI
jgi:L-malate glycosyltransferase